MWIFSIPSACQLSPLPIDPGSGQRPICEMRADGPEGASSPFVRHFHFVWVLSGPLAIPLEFLAAARVVICVSRIIVSSVVLCFANDLQSILSFCALCSAMTYPVQCSTGWNRSRRSRRVLSPLERILTLVSGPLRNTRIRTWDRCARRLLTPVIKGGPAVIYR